MTEDKALKKSRKINELIRELNDYNEAKMAASTEPGEPGEDFGDRKILPCTAIINGYAVNVDCKTGAPLP